MRRELSADGWLKPRAGAAESARAGLPRTGGSRRLDRGRPHQRGLPTMLKSRQFEIAAIRVPVKRAKTLDPVRVNAIAESMLDAGQTTPILVRPDGVGFVLVEGLHRLEAKKALGDTTIEGYLVQARKH